MNIKKRKSTGFLILKIIGFLAVALVLFYQLRGVDVKKIKTIHIENSWFLVLAILLLIPNLWVAFQKWNLIIEKVDSSTSHKIRLQSFFAGVVTGFLTPNMLGNFLGRIYYFRRPNRILITTTTLFSNFTQFLSTLFIGIISWGLVETDLGLSHLKYWVFGVFFVSITLFFFGEKILFLVNNKNWARSFQDWMGRNKSIRYKLLMWSVIRLLIFTSQFSLMLACLGESLSVLMIGGILQVYLFMLFMPSLFLAKLGVKESISIFVLSSLGLDPFNILIASLSIWLLNNVLPSLFGVVICKEKRFA